MKWIVGVLILVNVGLFMWGKWYHQPLVSLEGPRPPVDIEADKIKLLTEPGAKPVLRTRTPPASPAPEAPLAESRCYRLGPFPSLEKARAAGNKLDAWGLTYERVAELETAGSAYRVMLPPLASREAADRQRRELTKLGFTDHALIQHEEGLENAISLGVFTVEQNARVRVQQLARKGVKATIQLVPNVHAVYWLALAGVGADGQIVDLPLDRFKGEDWGFPLVALRPTDCDARPAAGTR